MTQRQIDIIEGQFLELRYLAFEAMVDAQTCSDGYGETVMRLENCLEHILKLCDEYASNVSTVLRAPSHEARDAAAVVAALTNYLAYAKRRLKRVEADSPEETDWTSPFEPDDLNPDEIPF